MTTSARIRADRQNSIRSTGPRTRVGKARSSQSQKHTLTIPVHLIPSLEPEIDALARLIAPDEADAVCYEAARSIAAAQIDLKRVKAARSVSSMRRMIRARWPKRSAISRATFCASRVMSGVRYGGASKRCGTSISRCFDCIFLIESTCACSRAKRSQAR